MAARTENCRKNTRISGYFKRRAGIDRTPQAMGFGCHSGAFGGAISQRRIGAGFQATRFHLPSRGRVNKDLRWTSASRRADLGPKGLAEDSMYRTFLVALAALLVAVAPFWSYSSGWSFGPFLAVLFLLTVNLVNFLLEDPLNLDAEPALKGQSPKA